MARPIPGKLYSICGGTFQVQLIDVLVSVVYLKARAAPVGEPPELRRLKPSHWTHIEVDWSVSLQNFKLLAKPLDSKLAKLLYER